VTARSVLVCSFKVILPNPLFPLCRDHAVHEQGKSSRNESSRRAAASVVGMTSPGYRRPIMITAAVIAVISLVAVGTVMAVAFNGGVPPVWVTWAALYGLPVAFMLAVVLVVDSVRQRRRQ
jgi:hypothetical protein